MANNGVRPNGCGNWDPATPKGDMQELMEPKAADDPECVSESNPQEEFVGGKGAQRDPLGKKGREF